MKLILDRLEGDIAVFENEARECVNAPVCDLIPKAIIGGEYHLSDDKYILDTDGTDERKKRIREKMKKVFGK